MEAKIYNMMAFFMAIIFSTANALSQITTPVPEPNSDGVYVYPHQPSAIDSIYVTYTYVSSDGCPDYFLVRDSAAGNNVYVSQHAYPSTENPCIQVISKFSTTINLGILPQQTNIWFNGKLIKTIVFQCIPDRKGVVVECGNRLYIQELPYYPDSTKSSSDAALPFVNRLFSFNNNPVAEPATNTLRNLRIGDNAKFGADLLPKDSIGSDNCAIAGFARCYQLIDEQPRCIMNKTGVVVACAGQLYIRQSDTPETSDVNTSRLFHFMNQTTIDAAGNIRNALNVGDSVMFGGYLFTSDSVRNTVCPVAGVAKCYQLVYEKPDCIMDKTGLVVDCGGQLYIRELTAITDSSVISPDKTQPTVVRLYTFINNTAIDPSGTILKTMKAGDKVKFGAILLKKDSAYVTGCPIVGIVKCYQLIYIQPECMLDRTGIVISCGGQLYIEENTPYASPIARLFRFAKNPEANPALKAGDKVKFGGLLFATDSINTIGCRVVGIAQCYELIDTTTQCTYNRKGVVEEGIDGCIGKLFILEDNSGLRFLITNNYGIYADATYTGKLQAGDRVVFSGYLISPKDSTVISLCPYDGVAVCYIPVYPATSYVLKGSAMGGDQIMTRGYAILFAKGQRKAIASYAVTDGVFEFKGKPQGEYTVYVIPEKTDSARYLPTFYVNKLFYRNADYVMLTDNLTSIKVELRPFVRPMGTGRIHGNIYYESGNLNDNILAKNGWEYTANAEIFMMAVNIPVLLVNPEKVVVAWTLTDVYGNYAFENVATDNYTVQSETGAATGESTVTVDAANMDVAASFTLKSTESTSGTTNPQQVVTAIYPNPTSGKITLVVSEKQLVSFYNTMGQLLKQEIVYPGSHKLDISPFAKGVYFVRAGASVVKLIRE
jgi:hypothetical protein